ncbi:MAG: cupin domain-containing protein [Chloroflexi bacterium]|nr:cupin domain-containing protein [Chloroflexota bacterium]
MAVLRRSEQEHADRYPGVPRYSLSGPETGAASLHVGHLTFLPGSSVPYHYHPGEAEETQFMISGELECWLDGHRLVVRGGDTVLAKPGTLHAFVNRTDTPAEMVTMFPVTPPETVHVDDPDSLDDAESHPSIIRAGTRAISSDGITRHELTGSFSGAASTYAVLNRLEAGAEVPLHFHPDHEAGLYCLDGAITLTYGALDETVLAAGDYFAAIANEPHGYRNHTNSEATILVVHAVLEPPQTVEIG